MFASVQAPEISGMDVIMVRVEADASEGLPSLYMVERGTGQNPQCTEKLRYQSAAAQTDN